MANKLSPFVYWGQSADTISLKVDLRSVENVEVNLTEESLDFRAQGQGVKGINTYSFHLDFYLPVDPEKSRYRKTDIAVEFQIEKSAAQTWPRLTSERLKLPWLKIDFDKFPLDDSAEDSESDNAQQSQEELIDRITMEMGKDLKTDKLSMSKYYLFAYNLFQFVGYAYIFVVCILGYIKDGDSAKQGAFETAGTQMMVCQIVAALEILHPLLGLVRGSALMAFTQVYGRNTLLFLMVLQEPRLQISPLCWYLFVVWAGVEVIRYPFYMLQILNMQVKYLTWLRYTIWIPLYPLGMMIEATMVYQSISYFSETGFFSFALPNSGNIAFYFPYYLIVHLLIIFLGGPQNLKYMYQQRQKQLPAMFSPQKPKRT